MGWGWSKDCLKWVETSRAKKQRPRGGNVEGHFFHPLLRNPPSLYAEAARRGKRPGTRIQTSSENRPLLRGTKSRTARGVIPACIRLLPFVPFSV